MTEPSTDYVPLTMEQIEAFVEEVIEANAVWPDPLPSQRDAVMDVLREAMAQAWDEGFDAGERDVFNHDQTSFDEPCIENPYRVIRPGGGDSDV